MKPVETTRRIEAIKEKVKAKTIVEQQERDERPPLKLLERQILVSSFFSKLSGTIFVLKHEGPFLGPQGGLI